MTDQAADEYVVIEAPADGVPEVVRTPDALAAATAVLAAGSGPVAIDTERAQGFRYSARAYLIQYSREGAGTVLLDPIPFTPSDAPADLSGLADALADSEWVLHAATQDLPCLAEAKLLPHRLFDTELAARLLGMPRVALGTLMEEAFGLTLRKEHSAADWSKRPLPDEWLNYAALDVEKLVDLRALAGRTAGGGRQDRVGRAGVRPPGRAGDRPAGAARRTVAPHVGSARRPTPRALAVVRELWLVRDRLASGLTGRPARCCLDRAITALAARANPAEIKRLGPADLAAVPEFAWRFPSRYRARWLAALDRVASLPRDQLPTRQAPPDGPPPTRAWELRNPTPPRAGTPSGPRC